MFHINDYFTRLPGSYLFAEIARRVKAYSAAHPDADIIRLGIGDVTRPLAPAVIEAMHKAVSEMGVQETFHGYGPDYGYDFLVNAIREHDYASRGVQVDFDEVFKSLKNFSDLIGKTDRPEVLQSFVKSRVARIEMSPDKKKFKLKLRAFDGLYQDREWYTQKDSNLRPSD